MRHRLGSLACLAVIALAAGCDSNPDGPSSPSATSGPTAAGTESETAAPKERRVKNEGGPASEK